MCQLVLCGCSDLLTGHSVLLDTLRVFVGNRGLTIVRTSHYHRPPVLMKCLWLAVALCAFVRVPCFHLHKVLEGLPPDILQTGSGRTDGRDAYGVIRSVPMILVFGDETPLAIRPVATRRPNVGGRGRCWPNTLKLVCTRWGNLPS